MHGDETGKARNFDRPDDDRETMSEGPSPADTRRLDRRRFLAKSFVAIGGVTLLSRGIRRNTPAEHAREFPGADGCEWIEETRVWTDTCLSGIPGDSDHCNPFPGGNGEIDVCAGEGLFVDADVCHTEDLDEFLIREGTE
jgi:hypothetical protein